jgi:hypothetical protein
MISAIHDAVGGACSITNSHAQARNKAVHVVQAQNKEALYDRLLSSATFIRPSPPQVLYVMDELAMCCAYCEGVVMG